MSSTLRAALVLTLDDKLSSGLKKVKEQLDGLKNIGRGLGLGKLEFGGDVLRRLAADARAVVPGLNAIIAAADRGWAALKRMGSAAHDWGAKTFGPQSRMGAFAAAAEGYSFIKPIREWADYDNALRHAAITEGLSGNSVEAEIGRLRKMFAREALETGQSSMSIAEAFRDLLQTGLTLKEAEGALPTHARAGTAYDISTQDLGHPLAALIRSFKISSEELPAAIAAMALAAKQGLFKMPDFAAHLPGVGGAFAQWGMKGRAAANTAYAGLEITARNTTNPEQAAVYFGDLIHYMGSQAGMHAFKRQGIDLGAELLKAEKGVNPFDAFMDILRKQVAGLSPAAFEPTLSKFLHNQQAGGAAGAILQTGTISRKCARSWAASIRTWLIVTMSSARPARGSTYAASTKS